MIIDLFTVKKMVKMEEKHMPRKGENIYKRKDGRWEARYIYAFKEDGMVTKTTQDAPKEKKNRETEKKKKPLCWKKPSVRKPPAKKSKRNSRLWKLS